MNFSTGPIALQYVTIDVLQSATLTRQRILNVIKVSKTRRKAWIKWQTDTTALSNSYINILAQCRAPSNQFEKVIASFSQDSHGHNSDHCFKVNENVKTVNRSSVEKDFINNYK